MPHLHSIYDTDLHFIIDPITRRITSESGKVTLMQNDHLSERFTFEVPRFIEGHDMSLTNVVQIHYLNISGENKRNQVADICEADDLQISPDGDDRVIFSWLISKNATSLAGTLHFAVRFVCYGETEIEYQWFSDIFKGINVNSSIYNTDVLVEDYDVDILESWKRVITATAEKSMNAAVAEAQTAIDETISAAEDRIDTAVSTAESSVATTVEEAQETLNAAVSAVEGNLGSYVEKAESAADEAETTLNEARKTLSGAEFNVNFDSGHLEYTSIDFKFSTNIETGNLEWEVSN